MPAEIVIPERIQLESVFGCNARCTMCPVHRPSKRKKGTMSFELFKYIVDELTPYKDSIKKFDFWALGEPLLDKNLVQKVAYAKGKGFRSLAIATNADLLTSKLAGALFEAGLDTIIFSIDGTSKETHEGIRVNTDFDRVINNAEQAIMRRDEGGYATRFVFRFLRQACNHQEWDDFRRFWSERISKDNGDKIIVYDAHTWSGAIKLNVYHQDQEVSSEIPCHHIFDRLIILSDGTVAMCCSDLHLADHAFGNVKDASPIEIFNNIKAQKIREIHKTGKRLSMNICKKCTILKSEKTQETE